MPESSPQTCEATPQRLFATDSGEEEMPDEEEDETPLKGKGKSKAKAKAKQPQELTCKSLQISKPSYYVTCLLQGEGTTIAEDIENHPSFTPSESECHWYHPDWPGPSASSAYISGDISTPDFAFLVEVEELMQAALTEAGNDLKTLAEVQSHSDWPKWQQVMDHKIDTLEKAGTWTTVLHPSGKNIVGSKWVFCIKRNSDGTIEKYKACLIVCGFTQKLGVDYFDTFSPVVWLASFRTILAITAHNDWEIHTFNFNSAYLNGELNANEDIFMQPPPGYESQGEFVKHLRKSLYGLKQAGCKWYDTLCHALADLGFSVNNADPGMFYTRINKHILILAIHVDDCLMTGSSINLITDYKKRLNAKYSLTDLGKIH